VHVLDSAAARLLYTIPRSRAAVADADDDDLGAERLEPVHLLEVLLELANQLRLLVQDRGAGLADGVLVLLVVPWCNQDPRSV
jgi:hypothetical protein